MNKFKSLLLITLTLLLIQCDAPEFPTLGGKISGLDGTIVLKNNFGETLTIKKNGTFSFPNPVLFNTAYRITIQKHPAGQNCLIQKGEGKTKISNITNVRIICDGSPASPEDATISTVSATVGLVANGPSGSITITNNSTEVTATDISSDFTGTALDGNVTETGNTCATLPPGASCVLVYTPGNTAVGPTDFPIAGGNTNTLTASIEIVPGSTLVSISPTSGSASGGTGFTLTGTNLTSATGITFGGIAATSVSVINSSTVTGVTPAHAAGAVDVVIATSLGGATLTNGYTYVTTAVGQLASGGTIGCLNGALQNFIAATADNSTGTEWGGFGVTTNAQSDTDGAANTVVIVLTLGNNGGIPYPAQICSDYEIDSQGNTPCEAGNTCYNDWFDPSKDQLNCLYNNQVTIGGFAATGYWSSTEFSGLPNTDAWLQFFDDGTQGFTSKNGGSYRTRCVRAFTP